MAITLIACLYMLSSSHIHYKCGDIVYLYSGFTRASNEIDSWTPHFLLLMRLRSPDEGKSYI